MVDLAARKVSTIVGAGPSLSADGGTLTYITRTGPEYSVMVGPTTGTQVAVKRTTNRLEAPALSADGSRVAYQMMPRDDWEIFIADRDGASERRSPTRYSTICYLGSFPPIGCLRSWVSPPPPVVSLRSRVRPGLTLPV
jgi:Tol biopolymer transport system component